MNTQMQTICDNFIGGAYEKDTWTGSFETEYKYIEWLFLSNYGDCEEYSEEEIDTIWEKFQDAEGLGDFCDKEMVTHSTHIAVGNEIFRADFLATRNGDFLNYDGSKYILLKQAEVGDEYDASGKQIPCFSAPAIRIGDEIDSDGWCKRYRIVWDIYEDFSLNDDWDYSNACDWENPREVYDESTGEYNIKTGMYF